MNITRREFALSVSTLALAGALTSLHLPFDAPAFAQAPAADTAELLQPGPLPEIVLGKADAPVTIVEYASMTCPHCAHFSETTFPELKKRYIDTGKVRFIFREFPLDVLAAAGSMLARCISDSITKAGDSDKYVGMIELLFQTQRTWAVEKPLVPLFNTVKQTGFTQQSFDACLANQKLFQDIQAVRDRAADKFGVNSTPTFFINGKKVQGDLAIEDLEKELQPYLKA